MLFVAMFSSVQPGLPHKSAIIPLPCLQQFYARDIRHSSHFNASRPIYPDSGNPKSKLYNQK